MQIIIVITLLIVSIWTGQNIRPQAEEAPMAMFKSCLTIIILFIIALLVLKSPWCPNCYFLGGAVS